MMIIQSMLHTLCMVNETREEQPVLSVRQSWKRLFPVSYAAPAHAAGLRVCRVAELGEFPYILKISLCSLDTQVKSSQVEPSQVRRGSRARQRQGRTGSDSTGQDGQGTENGIRETYARSRKYHR